MKKLEINVFDVGEEVWAIGCANEILHGYISSINVTIKGDGIEYFYYIDCADGDGWFNTKGNFVFQDEMEAEEFQNEFVDRVNQQRLEIAADIRLRGK